MSLPWHLPLESSPSFKPKPEVPKASLLKHFCNIDIHGNPCEEVQTGIMCEISVSNKDPCTIQRLIASGITVAHLNMREMDPSACAQMVQSVRQAVYNYSAELEYIYPLALMIDIRGPDIFTGNLKTGPETTVEIIANSIIKLTTNPGWCECGTADCLYVGWEHLTDLKPGDEIFIESLTSGKIKLIVEKIGNDSVACKVILGGIIGSKMHIRAPKVPRENDYGDSIDSLSCSEKSSTGFDSTEEQIAWAIGSDIDAVLIPNTQKLTDIRRVRNMLGEKGKHILIFASIETIQGLDYIDEILTECDGIYLNRCILSTDLSIERIFIAQKVIFAKCNDLGKPCICEAVINEQIPTLCVTDIANLVLDGVDVLSIELHYQSPLKKVSPSYEAVQMAEHCIAAAGIICRQAERIVWRPKVYGKIELMQNSLHEPTKAICVTAVELAVRANAVVIICLTQSGRTAKILSHGSPPCPVIAVTRLCHTARQLRFWRGVRSMHYFEIARGNWIIEVECRVHAALDYCKAKGLIRAGDPYVVVMGNRRGGGYCDSVKLMYATARESIIVE